MIRHVLLDADGVLQELPGGWLAAVAPYAGEAAQALTQGHHVLLPQLADHGIDLQTP